MMSTNPVPTANRLPTLTVALAVPLLAIVAVVTTRAVEGPSSTATAASNGKSVVIKNFAFAPKTLTVAAGTKLGVTNADGTQHTLTANNGAFDTGVLASGKHAVVTLNQAGTYRYHCNIHQNMTGTVVVR
jgi:plastocyanin